MVYDPKQGCVRDLSEGSGAPPQVPDQQREDLLNELRLVLFRMHATNPQLLQLFVGDQRPTAREFALALQGLTRDAQEYIAMQCLRFAIRTYGSFSLRSLFRGIGTELDPVGR